MITFYLVLNTTRVVWQNLRQNYDSNINKSQKCPYGRMMSY